MGPDDDLAKFLPEAPPRPDRREAAIAEAMRRFDGEAPASAAPAKRPSFAWPKLGRAPMGAFVSLALVAIIGAPLALKVVQQEMPPVPVDQQAAGNIAMAPAASPRPAFEVAGEEAPSATRAAPRADAPDPVMAAEPVQSALREQPVPVSPGASMAPAPPPPAAPPAPPALARSADMEMQSSRRPALRSSEEQPDAVVVTGSRIARPDYTASSPIVSVAREAVQDRAKADAMAMAGSRPSRAAARAAQRGDWNACTVIDPARDLARCKGQVDPAAKGVKGRADTYISQGLTLAWQGNLRAAISVLDAAIALEPKNGFAQLNRGIAYARLGDGERALTAFDQAIRHAGTDARAYYHRSILLRSMDRERRAKADEDRAVSLDSRYRDLFSE